MEVLFFHMHMDS